MDPDLHNRPNPDALLNSLKKEEDKAKKGKLKIFFGMCAGVGKTYEMLKAAHEAVAKGIDVIVGYVETHHRPETDALLERLHVFPRKNVEYRETTFEEMDLDAILKRKPQLVLVDELAHTNTPGSRHTKRYQDIQELLDSGIDVYTTLNVQHLETRADTVCQITGATVRETVPDSIFEHADEVELIDIPPDELLKRLAEGKVYTPERSQRAIQNFFRKGNLTALREMSLRITAERVDHQLREFMQTHRISGPWKSGQRLIVGIGPSPQSASLIRWARRMAYTMNASWIAVYVETSRPMRDPEKEQLAKNIQLARELGAEIFMTADEDVAHALVRVARDQNATQILVGKSQQRSLFHKNLLDRIIARSGDLDVYLVGGQEDSDTKSRRIRFPAVSSRISQYIFALASISATALFCYPLREFMGYETISLILLLIVALLPLRLGAGPVLAAAAVSALVWDYFFIPPQFTLTVSSLQDALMLLAYFAIAAVSGTLTARIRAREKAVRQREERTTVLYSLTSDLAKAINQDEVTKAAVSNIQKYFNADVAVFLSDPEGEVFTKAHPASLFTVDSKEFAVAAWVYWNEKKAGKFTETLPSAIATYYPISGPRYPLGVVGIKSRQKTPLTIDQENLLQNFFSQIASSLEREQLNEITKKSVAFVESERLYKTLFNSLSHELRTPIAAIMSASESLLDEKTAAREQIRRDLIDEIHIAADRLDRLVENLFDMTRLESGRLTPKLDWCDVRDLFNASVRNITKELSKHNVTIDVPLDMPLVKIDVNLIEHAITNILHNASLYTPGGTQVQIRTFTKENNLIISISDSGPGFPKEMLHKVFEKFFRLPGTKAGGTGLGLSIAQGFVEAHGGKITVENKPDNGAQFTIQLPVEYQYSHHQIQQES
jgi:two-component system sensor histidine kinase KdpD